MKTSLRNLQNTTTISYFLVAVLTLTFTVGTLKSNAQCSLSPNFTNTIYSPTAVNQPRGLCSGDFNNDGKLDWAVCNQGSDRINVFLNNGTGGFTEAPGSGFSTTSTDIAIATGDVNGDGILDLVVTYEGAASISVFLGNGDGSFVSDANLAMLGANCRSAIVADVNHDGLADIVATSSNAAELGKLGVFISNGDGTFQSRVDYSMGIPPGGGSIWAFPGDMDNDGNLDIVYANEGSFNVSVVYGNSTGGFGNPVVLTPLAPNGTTAMTGATVGDFNGDGKLDIAACNGGQNFVDVWLNTGSRTFNTHTHYAVPSPYGMVSADFNNDGKIDLVTTNTGTTMTVLLGNGDGTFATNVNFSIPGANNSYTITGDFNGDGRPDIVETNQGSNNVYVWLNTTAVATATASSPVCSGGTISLAGTGPAGTTGYHWTGPNGFASSTQNPTVSAATTAKAGVYNLVATTSGGCSSFASTSAVVVTVASASASAISLCSANTLRLTGGPLAMKSYAWTGPSGFTSSLPKPILVNPAAGSGAYTLKVTDANGCTSTASTPTVTVNASVLATGTIGGTASVCPGQSGVIYSTTAIANAVTYAWTVPTGATISGPGTGASITVNFSGSAASGNITVAGVAAGSCGAGPVATFAVAVTTSPTLTGNQILNCVGATTSFGVSSGTGGTITSAGGYYIHTFTVAGTTTGVSLGTTTASTSYTFTPAVSGTVEYVVIGGGGGGGNGTNSPGNAGGGGAGGYRSSVIGETSGGGASVEPVLAVTAGVPITVVVGGGGAGTNNNGNNSSLGSIVALGGGHGAAYQGSSTVGGSGGGGGQNSGSQGALGTAGQGFGGGGWTGNGYGGGGGGGAGTAGANSTGVNSENGGLGGNGVTSSITGSAVTRAGGGGGSSHNSGTLGLPSASKGGTGGGGNGHYCVGGSDAVLANIIAAVSGVDGTGGGGGGGGEYNQGASNNTTALSGSGGAGIVLLRYPALPSGGTWTASNSSIATVDNSGNVTAAGSGTTNINYTYTGTCGSVTISRSVTVNASATATATATTPVCTSGTNSTLALTGSPTGQTYSWSGPNGFNSTVQNPVITNPSTAAAGVYTLTAVTNNGCSATATKTVVVNSPSITTNSNLLCAGQSITVGAHTYSTSGTYVDKILGTGGSCDNITITKLKVLYGNGVTSFKTVTIPTGLTGASNPRAVAIGDINGDGKLDVASVDNGDAKVQVFLGDGVGGFTLASSTPTASPTSSPVAIATADLNGDGRADIVTANGSAGNISVFTSNADGSIVLASGSPITIAGTINTVAIGDFNNDGKQDIAACNTASVLYILLGNGNGTFGSATTYSLGTGTTTAGIITGDFNGDGNLDIATANQSAAGAVSVLLGNGTGGFSAVTNYNSVTSGTPNCITTGDFNQDGITDFAVGNFGVNPASVTIFLGNASGNGTFTTGGSSTVSLTPGTTQQVFSLVSGDFNGDGLVDLAVADNTGLHVKIVTGNGDGTFNTPTGANIITIAGSSTPQGIAAADFNNDGRPDLVVATTGLATKALTVLINNNGQAVAGYTGGLCTTGTNTLSLLGLPAASTPAYNYSWSGPGAFASSQQNPTAIPSPTTGIYTLTVISPTNFCSSTATTNVVVSTNPTATASLTTPACTNGTLTFAGGPAAMTTYAWSGPNSFVSTSQNPVITSPTTLASGTYNLTVTDVNGCTSTASTSAITVNVAPTLTPTTASICYSTGTQIAGLTYTSTGNPDTYSISTWTASPATFGIAGFNNVLNAALAVPTPITISVPAGAPSGTSSTTYQGVITIKNSTTGCSVTNGLASLVTITALPVIAVSPANGVSSCSGAGVSLTASGATTYAWSPSTFLSATTGASVTASSPSSSLTYTVTGTTGACSATATVALVASNGLAGTFTIDNTVSGAGNLYPNTNTFNSFSSAVAALNCATGAVTFNVIAGETFAEPPVISTFTNPSHFAIIFQRSGGGANPVLMGTNGVTATAGTYANSTTAGDAVFKIVDGNNFTFNGIDLKDNPANGSTTTMMDFGLWLAGGTGATTLVPGCSNITYTNGNITLNTVNTNFTYGIYTQSTATVVAGENSNNTFTNNTIKNCAIGIDLWGVSTTFPDQNVVITGNTITALTSTPNGFRGINYSSEQLLTVSNNSVTNSTNITGNVGYGICANAGASSTANIFGNTISGLTGTNTGGITGVLINGSVSGGANIYNNVITGFTASNSGILIAIQYAPPASITNIIANNLISSFNASNSTAAVEGIVFVSSSGADVSNIYGNTITGLTTLSGVLYGIYNQTGSTTTTLNIYNNVVSALTGITTTTGPYGIYFSTSNIGNIYGNTISSITNTLAASGSVIGINILTNSNVNNLYNNLVTGVASTIPAATASSITATGISYTNNTGSTNNIYGNTITNVSTSSATTSNTGQITGMIVAGNQTMNVFRNLINNVNSATTTTGRSVGLQISATGTINTFNNMVYDIRANASTSGAPGGAVGLYYSGNSGTQKIYYNTIYLNGVATSGVAQLSAGFYAVTGGALDFRNNIWVNTYTPSGATSFAYAQWFNATTMPGTLTNNLLYVTPGAQAFDFYNTSTKYPGLTGGTGYQSATNMAGHGDATFSQTLTVSPATFFVSASSPYNVHLNGSPTDAVLKGSTNLGAPWTQDFDGDLRAVSGNTTIGADEICAVSSLTQPVITVPSPVCQGSSLQTFSVPSVGGVYNWSLPSDFTIVGGVTNSSISVTFPTAIAATTYTVSITESNGCTTSLAGTNTVTVNPGVINTGTISGTTNVCANLTGLVYSTATIPNATGGYAWVLPSGFTITAGANTNSITVSTSAGPSSGNVTVAGISACNVNGPIATFPVTVNAALPASAGITAPNGGAIVCPGGTGVIYSATAITGATAYAWTVPATLGTISGATNGQSITVSIAGSPVAGNITVAGVNLCGNTSGSTASFPVTVPSTTITGNTSITCIGSTTQLVAPPTIQASGGTITSANGYVIHTFTVAGTTTGSSKGTTTTSNFTFTPATNLTVQYLVIGGGGGGGVFTNGLCGGGGAGGYRCSVPGELSGGLSAAETPLSLTGGTAYAVQVGGGAAPGNGVKGTPSIFATITSDGGGGGGAYNNNSGGNGGSGGGGGQSNGCNYSSAGVPTQPNQGFAGGFYGSYPCANMFTGAGGGGAGGVGKNAFDDSISFACYTTNNWFQYSWDGGPGGPGIQSNITGTPTYRGGGGGGGTHSDGNTGPALGGNGGGGNGKFGKGSANDCGITNPLINPTSGTDGTGGGGGGGGDNLSTSGNGGAGIVIVRYFSPTSGTWSSDNTAVASVDPSTGIVTGNSVGTANISFTASGSCPYVASLPVTVSSSAFTVTATASPASLCSSGSNDVLTLTGSASETSNTSYSWTGPNGFTSTAQSPTVTNPSAAPSGSYTLTATNGACNATTTTNAVVVNATVTASGSISGPAVVCAGAAGNVYSTTSIANAVNYNWTVPSTLGTIVGTSTGSSITVTIVGSPTAGSISVVGVSAGSCGNGPSASYPITINATPAASAGITTTNGAVVCSSETGLVYSAATIPNVSSYQWTVPATVGTISGASNGSSITVTSAASPTGGTIIVAGVSVCGSASPNTTSYVVAGPTPASLTGNQNITCLGTTTQFSVPLATGGTITTAGGYRIHTFTVAGTNTGVSTGTTTSSSYTFTPAVNMTVQYLVIGGGGGAGTSTNALSGGGGAGGYRCSVPGEFSGGLSTAESQLSLTAGTPYTVVVGGGGAPGNLGSNSQFATVTSLGGGYGGSYGSGGVSGGSGGGGGQYDFGGATGGTATSATQGFAGGGDVNPPNGFAGGGGGGAGAIGANMSSGNVSSACLSANPTWVSLDWAGGAGGIGIQSVISGSPTYRAGGGGGGTHNNSNVGPALGGNGGGGNGKFGDFTANSCGVPANLVMATSGVDGTGGGGGGGGDNGATNGVVFNGTGGAGIVIIRYPDVSGGTWSSDNTAVATVNSSGVVTAQGNGTANISYTYTPSNSTCQLVSTRSITVAALTASATGTTPVCTSGTNSTLTLTATTNAGSPTYSWKGPNGFTSTVQNPSILQITPPPFTLSTASAGIYTLTVTDGTCGTATTAVSNTVVVNQTVTVTGSISGPSIVCSGATGLVYSTTTIAGAVSYNWTVPATLGTINGASNGSSITVDLVASPVSGSITVSGVSAGGCDPGPTATFAVGVNTATAASAGITSSNGAAVCAGQAGQIYSAVAIPGVTTYAWTVPASLGTITSGQGTNVITVTIAPVGVATSGNITVAGVNVCGSTSTNTTSFGVSVPATVVTGNTTLTCLGNTSQLTAPPSVSATGGTITNAAGFIIHTFTSSGTFTPATDMTVQFLVVAGGGGGGIGNGDPGNSGGGGAGGLRSSVPSDTSGGGASPESPLALTGGVPVSVVIGAGGTQTTQGNGLGSNSSFGSIVSLGGGYGGVWQGNLTGGGSGGSGGGAGQAGALVTVATGTTGQGTAGSQITPGSGACGGGGGGGAWQAGQSNFVGSLESTPNEGGRGGRGITSSITGTRVWYAGGGGGSSHGQGYLGVAGGACVGGAGGGGNGHYYNGGNGLGSLPAGPGPAVGATNGAPNTGGGGGGGGETSAAPGVGGSGIVIVRYTSPAAGTWSSDDTTIAKVSNTGLVTAIGAGIDTVRYTVVTGACPYVNKIPINVAPLVTPVASYTPPTCIGGTLALIGSGGPNLPTYSWTGPSGFTSTIQSPAITNLTTAASGIYTLTVTKAACTESTTTTAVVVSANPITSITESDNSGTTPNDGKICNLDVVTLTASLSGVTYSWTPNVGTTQIVTDSPSVSTTYTLVITDGNGCTATASSAVTVKTLPPVAVSPQSAVCLPVTNIALTASGATGYTWAPTANLTPTAGTSATETAQISLLTFYTVTGTDANKCSAQVVVPVATVATGGSITPLFSIICSGGTKTLTVVGAAGHDYIWEMSTDNATWDTIPGATNTTYTTASVNGNTNKFYRLLGRSNSCWNVASTTSEVDVSNPTITVTASSITDNTLILNWSPTGTGNYSITYSGTSSGFQTGATPPKVITGLTAEGTYSLVVTQTGIAGCSATGTVSATTLCAEPTNLTATPITVGVTPELTVSWNGPAGNYRVYYRPLYSYITFFTQDVTNATTTVLKKQGANNLYASNTYQIYVSRLDCPNTGNVGQPTSPIYVTTLPNPIVSCATPTIDTVFSSCPVLLEVKLEGGSGSYNVYIQRLTPTLQAVNSYSINSTDFVINALAGQQYLISADSRCGSTVSTLNIWHNQVTVKPICNAPSNLILSNPTCHGFTASWNADQCISNTISGYHFYMRIAGTINYNAYAVPLPSAGIGPHLIVSTVGQGKNMQTFVQSVYSCGGSVTYGPSSQIATITTLSAGCRDEEPTEQLQEDKPAVQQYSPDNDEVFSLYPNPNTGEFTVDLSRLSNNTDEVRIEVLNMIGQTVITQITSISDGHMSEVINLPNGTAAGTYIVRLTAGKNVYTAKMNISK